MSKIHTHYDNLKVSRMAPPEVIRAAYKALSQKYHPDKNPGDAKAARIMAILNSAYSTLSDTQRRREHDEWIAAEEWEIEWLESTKAEEEAKNKEDSYNPQWVASQEKKARKRTLRDPQWWLMLMLCAAIGGGGTVLAQMQFSFIPGFVASTAASTAVTTPVIDIKSAQAKPVEKPLPPVVSKVVQSIQLSLAGQEKLCDAPVRPDTAPNGENWPAKTGYIDGYKMGNIGSEVRMVLDNSHNRSDTMITVFDREKHLGVRYLLVRANEKYVLENLQAGNYEVQQQVLGLSAGGKANCDPASEAANGAAAAN